MADSPKVHIEDDTSNQEGDHTVVCPECDGERFVKPAPVIVGDHEVWPTEPHHPCYVCEDGRIPKREAKRIGIGVKGHVRLAVALATSLEDAARKSGDVERQRALGRAARHVRMARQCLKEDT